MKNYHGRKQLNWCKRIVFRNKALSIDKAFYFCRKRQSMDEKYRCYKYISKMSNKTRYCNISVILL